MKERERERNEIIYYTQREETERRMRSGRKRGRRKRNYEKIDNSWEKEECYA